MQNLVIDISKRGVIPPIIVTEYDSMSRFFTLRLLNNGADYTPPENANYSVWYETNDSKGWYDTITLPDETSRSAVVEDGNVLTVEVAEAATTSCGELAVMVTGNDGYQLTVSGIRLMSADVPGYDGAEVEDYYNVYIADMQRNAARAENAAQTAIEYGATIDVEDETLIIDHYDDAGEVETWATVSEAWAVGKRNGVDVPSTDETYHNNSKYYAGQAANSAVNAAASAETAEEAAELCFTTAIKTSASGAVASFSDGADNIPMQSVVAEITPVQSGSGDPSPTNIRPISGRTGLTVTRAGKNVLNNTAQTVTQSGVTFTVNDDKTVTTSGTSTKNANYIVLGVITLPAGDYVLSGCPSGGSASSYYIRINRGATASGAAGVRVATDIGSGAAFTLTEATEICVWMSCDNGQVMDGKVFKPMIRLASDTDDTYEPYTGTEIPVTWETEAGTVYGGTLDVVSGVLTVDRAIYTGTWAKRTSYSTVFFSSAPETFNYRPYQYTNCYCNCLPAQEEGTTLASLDNTTQFRASDRLYVSVQNITTLADLQAWIEANELQLCYQLATPQTYQLTPTEVRTLLGGNNIYTDAGEVSVEYVADTKLYIDNKIAELQALVLEN